MNLPTPSPWTEAIRAASSGPELLAFLCRRLTPSSDEGPALDDRRGEGPEEVFERLAHEDEDFRVRLEETIAGYFKSPESRPNEDAAKPVIRGLLETIARLALTGVFSPLRAWLSRNKTALLTPSLLAMGRAALSALAGSQPTGLAEPRAYWLRLWQSGPEAWQPRAFIGLRLQDPETAVNELPLVLRRARALGQDPGALLHGLWNQPSAHPLLCAWLVDPENQHSREAYEALAQQIPQELQAQWPFGLPGASRAAQPASEPPRSQMRRLVSSGGSERWLRDHRRVA
jgi:hypothetical protein